MNPGEALREGAPEGKLDRNGKRGIAANFALTVLCLGAMYAAAGTLSWPEGYVYAGLVLGYLTIYTLVLLAVNPRVLNERGRLAKGETRLFDLFFFYAYVPSTLVGLVAIGFDRRWGFSVLPWWTLVAGSVLFVLSSALGLWAISSNPYFECTNKVRFDENHEVVSRNPYAFVRHPGYLAHLASLTAVPMILRSGIGFAPFSLVSIAVVLRTWLEDIVLMEGLPGYCDYALRVRYRMIPRLW